MPIFGDGWAAVSEIRPFGLGDDAHLLPLPPKDGGRGELFRLVGRWTLIADKGGLEEMHS